MGKRRNDIRRRHHAQAAQPQTMVGKPCGDERVLDRRAILQPATGPQIHREKSGRTQDRARRPHPARHNPTRQGRLVGTGRGGRCGGFRRRTARGGRVCRCGVRIGRARPAVHGVVCDGDRSGAFAGLRGPGCVGACRGRNGVRRGGKAALERLVAGRRQQVGDPIRLPRGPGLNDRRQEFDQAVGKRIVDAGRRRDPQHNEQAQRDKRPQDHKNALGEPPEQQGAHSDHRKRHDGACRAQLDQDLRNLSHVRPFSPPCRPPPGATVVRHAQTPTPGWRRPVPSWAALSRRTRRSSPEGARSRRGKPFCRPAAPQRACRPIRRRASR